MPVRFSCTQHAADTAHHHAVARLRAALRVCPAQIDNRSVFAFLSAKV